MPIPRDQYLALPDLVDLALGNGYRLLAVSQASLDEWDEFESGFTAGYGHWLAEHDADDPEAEEVRRLAGRQHAAYFDGYRGVMGLAYLQLVAV
jgi:hypothetical protein